MLIHLPFRLTSLFACKLFKFILECLSINWNVGRCSSNCVLRVQNSTWSVSLLMSNSSMTYRTSFSYRSHFMLIEQEKCELCDHKIVFNDRMWWETDWLYTSFLLHHSLWIEWTNRMKINEILPFNVESHTYRSHSILQLRKGNRSNWTARIPNEIIV